MSSNPKIGDLVRAAADDPRVTPDASNAADYYKARRAFEKAHNNKTIGLVCDKRIVDGEYQVLIKWF